MKFLLLSCFLICGLLSADTKPNIVFILSDDQAWTDYGFMGHDEIKTPHLDKLAEKSLVFKRGYVASPICRPSLASMVTGLFPFDNGITGNDVAGMVGSQKRAKFDIPMRDAFHKHPSFIKALVAKGYLAHQSGKWWEGSYQDGGFTHGMTTGDPDRNGRHGDVGLKIGRTSMKPITNFIDSATAQNKPFLIWYAPFLPHTPHNPPKRLLDKYSKKDRAGDVAKYYAMCEWFDETCGQLTDYLKKKNIADNTMIIYICDNGWAPASTTPEIQGGKRFGGFALRSKASPYENGTRTPVMISWPGKVNPEMSPDLVHAIDIYPTIAAATGIDLPANLEGLNLLDVEARQKRKAVFGVCHSSHNISLDNPDETLQYIWCIEGDWKLLMRYNGKDTTNWRRLHNWDTQAVKLFNVTNDPHEKNELSAAHPEVVERLRQKMTAWHPVKTPTVQQ